MLENKASIFVFDLDGVVNWRVPAQKTGIPLLGHHNPERYTRPVRKVSIQREPDPYSLNTWSYLNAMRHLISPVFPDVVRVINSLPPNVLIFGNTGRPNEYPMIAATRYSLTIAGITDRFTDIYFRPKGQKTVEHKLAVSIEIAKQYGEENIFVADDNPYDLLPQALRLRKAQFGLIRDLTTEKLLSGVNMASDYPNVRVYQTLREALPV